jgi:hypothetical protein
MRRLLAALAAVLVCAGAADAYTPLGGKRDAPNEVEASQTTPDADARGLVTREAGGRTPADAFAVRCVNTAGTAFEACGGGGSGGGGGGDGKILDGTAPGEADVIGTAPVGTEQGLVVRPIPSGTQTVTGTVGSKILDGSAAGEADVLGSAPTGTEQGLVVRNIPSGTQTVAGTVGSKILDGTAAGEADVLGSAPVGTEQGLVVRNIPSGTQTVTVTGTVSGKILDGTAAGEADVLGAAPTGSEQGLVVRNIPSGTQTVSGTVTANVATFPDNEPFNVAQFGGSAVVTGTGASGAGIPRVTVANDSAVRIRDNAGNEIASSTGRPLDADRGLTVRLPAHCTSFVSISVTADTQRIYICAITLVANAAEIVSIVEGTGTACATSPVALWGSTTDADGMSFAANGGMAMAAAAPFIRTSVDGNNLCIRLNGTNRVTGMISYVVAPND